MAVMELTSRVAVVPGGVNIGVLRGDAGRCVLVDAGLHETAAKKAIKAVREELGGEVAAVLTTHGHADHFGGNATVVKRTGATVYAPAIDEAVLRYPILQPSLLFAGAEPPPTMRGNFLLAEASPVDQVVSGDRVEIEGIDVAVVPLRGHSPGQLGYVVDGVFFCADVVLPESVLDKYKIPYLYSLTEHLASLERCGEVTSQAVVPGHGPVLDDIGAVRDTNRSLALDVVERLLAFAGEWSAAEELLTRLLNHYGAATADAPGFYLLQPTVYAFLSHLQREGRVAHEVRQGRSLWRSA